MEIRECIGGNVVGQTKEREGPLPSGGINSVDIGPRKEMAPLAA